MPAPIIANVSYFQRSTLQPFNEFILVTVQTRRRLDNGTSKVNGGVDTRVSQVRPQMNDAGNEDSNSIAKLFEQGKNL